MYSATEGELWTDTRAEVAMITSGPKGPEESDPCYGLEEGRRARGVWVR